MGLKKRVFSCFMAIALVFGMVIYPMPPASAEELEKQREEVAEDLSSMTMLLQFSSAMSEEELQEKEVTMELLQDSKKIGKISLEDLEQTEIGDYPVELSYLEQNEEIIGYQIVFSELPEGFYKARFHGTDFSKIAKVELEKGTEEIKTILADEPDSPEVTADENKDFDKFTDNNPSEEVSNEDKQEQGDTKINEGESEKKTDNSIINKPSNDLPEADNSADSIVDGIDSQLPGADDNDDSIANEVSNALDPSDDSIANKVSNALDPSDDSIKNEISSVLPGADEDLDSATSVLPGTDGDLDSATKEELDGNPEETTENETAKDKAALYASFFKVENPVEKSDAPITGNITATLRFDYPQTLEAIQKQNITVVLKEKDSEDTIVKEVLSEIADTHTQGDYTIKLTAKNWEGDPLELSGDDLVSYFDISVSGLPQGNYEMSFSGKGYKEYTSNEITLEDYSKHLILGTSDATFTIGDVNKDGKVDTTDLGLITLALEKTDSDSLDKYDINKDGEINVIDVAYVNHQINTAGDEKQQETAFILLDKIKNQISADKVSVEGDLNNLFKPDTESVKLLSKNGNAESIEIPLVFQETVEIEQLEIVSPAIEGAVEQGTVLIGLENGDIEEYPFGGQQPMELFATSKDTGTSSITINLNRRVAVKSVVIQVTKVKDQDTGKVDFTVVQDIKFLKDIVPENPTPANVTVRNIKAKEENESVVLTWSELPNITGYRVKYGTAKGKYPNEVTVNTTEATISGLKNLTTYYFVVIPINEDWSGNVSAEVSATPQPSEAPSAPDMVNVTSMDGALQMSWQKAKNATYYKVYYKEDTEGSEFILAGSDVKEEKITDTKKSIGSLKNDQKYLLYVVAGNSNGESKPSIIVSETPKKISADKPEGIPDGNLTKDDILSVTMPHKDYWDKNAYPNFKQFPVENIYDDNYSTHWTARAWWESTEFTYVFNESHTMNYLIYVPRLDGKFRNSLDNYTVKVYTGNSNNPEGKDFVVAGQGKVRNDPKSTGFAILPFTKTDNIKAIKVSVTQWAGSPTNISLSEILFYNYDPNKDISSAVADLFENGSFTALKSDVTQGDIDALEGRLKENQDYMIDNSILKDELQLATELLKGNQDAIGIVHSGLYSRKGLQPLGIAAKAGNKIAIYADIPNGEKVSIEATQYFAEAAAWKQTVTTQLENGRNIITVPKIGSIDTEHGGSLYLTYSGSNGNDIEIQVRGGSDIPVLELTDWYTLLEEGRKALIKTYIEELNAYSYKSDRSASEAVLNSTEISMPNVLLSIPADKVKSALPSDIDGAVQKLYNNTLAWEDVMHIINYTHGISDTYEKSNVEGSRQNIRYMRMFSGAFMFAAGSYIGIGYGSCGGMAGGSPISLLGESETSNHLYGWGIAHEIGHNMDLLGKAEITNNIYSLMVQTYDGKDNTFKSRLETSNKYESIWQKVAMSAPGSANDVFVQLGMYWQLHLAYDEGKSSGDPMGFYHKFFEKWSAGEASGMGKEDRMAVIASQVANKDLTEFFTRWGVQLSDDAKSQMSHYAKEDRCIWYLNDDARRYRLNSGTGLPADTAVTLTATVNGDKSVNLTFEATNSDSDIIGYEILRNGKSIAFTTDKNYEDVIGTANNLTYSYTVRAIDKLGMPTPVSNAQEIRISYDKTIDASQYTYSQAGGVATAVMKNPMAVTGIKVINAPVSGEYTVEIKKSAEDGSYVIAKEGNFSNRTGNGTDFIAYFNKPGTSDTRMWTFDASEIKVTGLPEGAAVQFISYPGDNIAFDNIAMGKIAEDYHFGEGKDDVIKQGTVIITGTYRGDPVYNTIQVDGRFVSAADEKVDNEDGPELQVVERAIAGKTILFAEIPDDGKVSDISDGIFFFIPDIQKEAELQNKDITGCETASLFPTFIKAKLYRTDDPKSDKNKRLVSDTLWIPSSSVDLLPEIHITSDADGEGN